MKRGVVIKLKKKTRKKLQEIFDASKAYYDHTGDKYLIIASITGHIHSAEMKVGFIPSEPAYDIQKIVKENALELKTYDL